jgi:hypothetical protein
VITLRPGFFLTGNGWPDPDGEHVWIAHDCIDRRDASKMPNYNWRLSADGKTVVPSFSCSACGFHAVIHVGEPESGEDK